MTDSTKCIPVVFTIDTEPDNAWDDHLNPSVLNIRELLRLQELFDRYCAKSTFLVTYRVVMNDEAVTVLRELADRSGAEIGAHLHPWETPPFMNSEVDYLYPTYPHELPLGLFEQKIVCLTKAITDNVCPPTSYRGGRWSVAPKHLSILEELGYEVDSSIIPLIDWRPKLGIPTSKNGRGGLDYRYAPYHPYHPDRKNILLEGGSRILEIPITAGCTGGISRFAGRLSVQLATSLQYALRKTRLLQSAWATPAESTEESLLRLLSTAIRRDTPVLNIALHSSEIAVACSPKSRTKSDVDQILGRIRTVLEFLEKQPSCEFCTLTEAARRWKKLHGPHRKQSENTRSGSPPTAD